MYIIIVCLIQLAGSNITQRITFEITLDNARSYARELRLTSYDNAVFKKLACNDINALISYQSSIF